MKLGLSVSETFPLKYFQHFSKILVPLKIQLTSNNKCINLAAGKCLFFQVSLFGVNDFVSCGPQVSGFVNASLSEATSNQFHPGKLQKSCALD